MSLPFLAAKTRLSHPTSNLVPRPRLSAALDTCLNSNVQVMLVSAPAGAGTIMLTSPVHVLDLGFLLPLGFVGAVWLLWQRKPWGYLLAGLLMVMMTIETASIAVDQYFGHVHDPSASPDAVPLFTGLTGIGLIVSVAYLYFLRSKSNSKEGLT